MDEASNEHAENRQPASADKTNQDHNEVINADEGNMPDSSLEGSREMQQAEEREEDQQDNPPTEPRLALDLEGEFEPVEHQASTPSSRQFYQNSRSRRYAKWDMVLVAVFVLLFALGGWIFYQRSTAVDPWVPVSIGPQPELALKREAGGLWVAGERLAALEKWQAAHQLNPANRDLTESLARAHVAVSTDYLINNEPDAALPHLEAAYVLMPDEEVVTREYQVLQAYLMGREAIEIQDWAFAKENLAPLHNLDPGYLDVSELMEIVTIGEQQTHLQQVAQQTRALSQARSAEPGRSARGLLSPTEFRNLPGQKVMPSLGPFAPPSSKHIVVSINAQRMYVYEDGQLIWNWVASTGETARPTHPGRYRIQSKFENARSNAWQLWMPYWQGIYWAGGSENGIHGQVVSDHSGRIWDSFLGSRVTFGCVMVGDYHASILYNWAELGTPISIHWDWNPNNVPNANGDPS